jgi:hypothetical protein
MRDLNKTIDYIERGMLQGLDRKPTPLPRGMVPKPLIRAWRAPVASDAVYPVEQVFHPKDKLKDTSRDTPRDTPKDMPMTTRLALNARALKVTVPLDAAEIMGLPAPDGQARSQLAITCGGKIYTADIATKSLRKAKATITANGAEHVFVLVQGKLRNNEIVECGLVAQAKTPKPVEAVG